jgi:hypothetical protein
MVVASISYDAALESVRKEYVGGKITKPDCKVALTLAYCHHKEAYRATCDDAGKALRGSALERKVDRDVKAIVNAPAAERSSIAVPANILALATAFTTACAEYEQAGKLRAAAIAQSLAK